MHGELVLSPNEDIHAKCYGDSSDTTGTSGSCKGASAESSSDTSMHTRSASPNDACSYSDQQDDCGDEHDDNDDEDDGDDGSDGENNDVSSLVISSQQVRVSVFPLYSIYIKLHVFFIG